MEKRLHFPAKASILGHAARAANMRCTSKRGRQQEEIEYEKLS